MVRERETVVFLRDFGQAVREAREELGWSQEELGFEAGLDRTYVSGVERGKRNPTLRIVRQVCRALGVRPSTLIRRAEDAGGLD